MTASIAKAVEEDTIEARDVTREYVDQEASAGGRSTRPSWRYVAHFPRWPTTATPWWNFFLNFPVITMWGFTIVALLKVGRIMLQRIILLFFPGLATWLRRLVQSQAT